MKLILELLFTSTHSLPIFTSGQYLLHSKLHLEGLHYTSRFLPSTTFSPSTIAIRVLAVDIGGFGGVFVALLW